MLLTLVVIGQNYPLQKAKKISGVIRGNGFMETWLRNPCLEGRVKVIRQ